MLWRRWGRAGASSLWPSLCLACASLRDGRRIRAPPGTANGTRRSRGRPPSLCVIRPARGNRGSRGRIRKINPLPDEQKIGNDDAGKPPRNDTGGERPSRHAAPARAGVRMTNYNSVVDYRAHIAPGIFHVFPWAVRRGAAWMRPTDRTTDGRNPSPASSPLRGVDAGGRLLSLTPSKRNLKGTYPQHTHKRYRPISITLQQSRLRCSIVLS